MNSIEHLLHALKVHADREETTPVSEVSSFDTEISDPAADSPAPTYTSSPLDAEIKEQILMLDEARGMRIHIGQGNEQRFVRVFDRSNILGDGIQNFGFNSERFQARGLQFARAALFILENSPFAKTEDRDEIISELLILTDAFRAEMNQLKNERIKDNLDRMYLLMSDLEKLLIDADCVHKKHVHQDLLAAGEIIEMLDEDRDDILCTLRERQNSEGNTYYCFQISERITFPEENLLELKNSTWYKQKRAKHAAWFQVAMESNEGANLKKVSTQSPTPSIRDISGNPANCWNDYYIVTDTNFEPVVENRSIRLAITPPLKVGPGFNFRTNSKRVNEAAHNMDRLLTSETDTRPNLLDEAAEKYNRRFGHLYESSDASTLPVFYQSLITDSWSHPPEAVMRREKTKGDEKIHGKIERYTSTPDNENQQHQFKFLEVNNCINLHRPLAHKSNRDINDSKRLLMFFNPILEKLVERCEAPRSRQGLRAITSFLNSRPYGFTSYTKIPKSDRENVNHYLNQLLEEEDLTQSGLDLKDRRELASAISAGIELKRVNQESIAGLVRRKLNNLPFIGPILFRPLTAIIYTPIKFLYLLFTGRLFSKKHNPWLNVYSASANKETFKSINEQLLGDILGLILVSCKSSMDRVAHAQEMKDSFIDFSLDHKGKLPSLEDMSQQEYDDFYERYVKPVSDTHHHNEVAAGSDHVGGKKLAELRSRDVFDASVKDEKLASTARKAPSSNIHKAKRKAAKKAAQKQADIVQSPSASFIVGQTSSETNETSPKSHPIANLKRSLSKIFTPGS